MKNLRYLIKDEEMAAQELCKELVGYVHQGGKKMSSGMKLMT